MAAVPILEELSGSASGRMIGGFANMADAPMPPSLVEQVMSRRERRLSIYPATAGFELVEELDFLAARSIEPNIFFQSALPRSGHAAPRGS